ncbi:hypothetical protein ALCH109712_07390 [Alkalicoccus chagannorensis]
MTRVDGLILAAGMSTRMGRPKMLLKLDGRPLIQWAVSTALDVCDHVYIAAGREHRLIRRLTAHPRVEVLYNPEYQAGQGTSLARGIEALETETDGMMVFLADQPFIPVPVAARVREQGEEAMHRYKRGFAVQPVCRSIPAHPVFWGRPQGLPPIRRGDRAGKALMQALPVETIAVREAWTTFDIDTPEQWHQAGELVSRFDFSYNFRNTVGRSLAGTGNS